MQLRPEELLDEVLVRIATACVLVLQAMTAVIVPYLLHTYLLPVQVNCQIVLGHKHILVGSGIIKPYVLGWAS